MLGESLNPALGRETLKTGTPTLIGFLLVSALFCGAEGQDAPAKPNLKPTIAKSVPAETRLCAHEANQILTTTVGVTVSVTGLPTGAGIAHSSGNACLDEAAVKAVERYVFSPATDRKGRPKEQKVSIFVNMERVAAKAGELTPAGSNRAVSQVTRAGTPIYRGKATTPPRVLVAPEPEFPDKTTGPIRVMVTVSLVVNEAGSVEQERIVTAASAAYGTGRQRYLPYVSTGSRRRCWMESRWPYPYRSRWRFGDSRAGDWSIFRDPHTASWASSGWSWAALRTEAASARWGCGSGERAWQLRAGGPRSPGLQSCPD